MTEQTFDALHSRTPRDARIVRLSLGSGSQRVEELDGTLIELVNAGDSRRANQIQKLVAGWEKREYNAHEIVYLSPALSRAERFDLLVEYADDRLREDIHYANCMILRSQGEGGLQRFVRKQATFRAIRDIVGNPRDLERPLFVIE